MQPTDRRAVFKPKLLESLRNYSGSAFQADLAAGITVGIVALPLCLALGIASGVRPVRRPVNGTRLCRTTTSPRRWRRSSAVRERA
jgi:hypothetical protein